MIKTIEELDVLIALLKRNGVSHAKVGDIELKIETKAALQQDILDALLKKGDTTADADAFYGSNQMPDVPGLTQVP